MSDIRNLEPKTVWDIFHGMTQVPRPSKKEEKIQAHMLKLAESYGFKTHHDAAGNIVVDVPATPGCENAPITVIQGHLDMVCEKNRGTEHDFDNDAIKTQQSKDEETGRPIVKADGTTLGADNGMGVAMALAAAVSKDVKHGPLELLLTADEEAGMTGAKALKPDSFKGRQLINLDAEEDDHIYIGCAGGCDSNLFWSYATSPIGSDEMAVRLTVTGLRGGHSGGDIHEGRGNAIKLMMRSLRGAEIDLRIGEVEAGSMRNAIPREAHAVVAVKKSDIDKLKKSAATVQAEGRAESYEANLEINVSDESGVDAFASTDDTTTWLTALAALPNGVLGLHPKVPALVETSNNCSTIKNERGNGQLKIQMGCLTRGSSDSQLEVAKAQIAAVAQLTGADLTTGNQYSGWEPNPDSKLLKITASKYEALFGEPAHVAAIHAGLECGIIGKNVGGNIDMISFGPTIRGAHSPDERVFIDGVEKSYKLLCAVLEELAG